jgi:hypothetical protein
MSGRMHNKGSAPGSITPPDFERDVHCLLGLPIDAIDLAEAERRVRGGGGAAAVLHVDPEREFPDREPLGRRQEEFGPDSDFFLTPPPLRKALFFN